MSIEYELEQGYHKFVSLALSDGPYLIKKFLERCGTSATKCYLIYTCMYICIRARNHVLCMYVCMYA